MSKLLKSKLGMVFAGIYLLVLFMALVEGNIGHPEPMDNFGLLILTAPFSFFLGILFDNLGLITKENNDALFYAYVIFGGLINALILYLIGYLFTKLLNNGTK
jgi:hypothetical protein